MRGPTCRPSRHEVGNLNQCEIETQAGPKIPMFFKAIESYLMIQNEDSVSMRTLNRH